MTNFMHPSPSFSKSKWPFIIISLALITGLFLSLIAFLELCSESCADTRDYRFFNFPFAPVGLIFFTITLLLHFCSKKVPFFERIVSLLIFGALGAEVMFILVQKFEIGQWCPVCLSIAASLAIAGITLAVEYFLSLKSIHQSPHYQSQKKILQGFLSIVIMLAGFFLAYAGVNKPDKTDIESDKTLTTHLKGPRFGKKDSPIAVFIITDWFCPACHHLEPTLEKMYPNIAKKAGVIFIDFPIHPESVNYTPYNISFMIHEKEKYFQIRQALQKLTAKTKAPSAEEVQAAVNPFKVKYQPLNYVEIDNGMQFFDGIVKAYNVRSTPSIVIVNTQTNHFKLLHGAEITETHVLQAINELNQ